MDKKKKNEGKITSSIRKKESKKPKKIKKYINTEDIKVVDKDHILESQIKKSIKKMEYEEEEEVPEEEEEVPTVSKNYDDIKAQLLKNVTVPKIKKNVKKKQYEEPSEEIITTDEDEQKEKDKMIEKYVKLKKLKKKSNIKTMGKKKRNEFV